MWINGNEKRPNCTFFFLNCISASASFELNDMGAQRWHQRKQECCHTKNNDGNNEYNNAQAVLGAAECPQISVKLPHPT